MREYLEMKCRIAQEERDRRYQAVEYYGYRIAIVLAGLMMGLGLPIVWLLTK